MLEKILKIENIKQWQHKGGLNQTFDQLNLIYGRNGSGKSTLCKIFESINLKDKSSIQALQPIESQGKQNLQLKFNSYNLSLDNLQSDFPFRVFNQAFIDNNLYISNSKDRKQLSNYYDFSLGYVSVEKEKKIDHLKSENESLTAQISPITIRLSTKFPSKTITQIRSTKEIPDCNKKIEILKEQLQDLKSVEHFKKRKSLSLLSLDKPKLDTDIFTLNIETLSKEAEEKVNLHIAHNLKEQDKQWIELGTNLVTESNQCPFCAQSLTSSPIFHLYQEFINESYLTASSNFELSSSDFELNVIKIGVKIEELEQIVKINKEIIREWADRLDEIPLDYNFSLLNRLSTNLELESYKLVREKKKDLLSKIDLTIFHGIFHEIFDGLDFTDYNKEVNRFNEAIKKFIDSLAKDTMQSIQFQIDEIETSKLRFSPEVIEALEEIKRLESIKTENTSKIKELREEITKEQEESIKNHKDSINEILQSFHSMIRIKELEKDNRGKGGSTRLKYVITFINNELSALDEEQHHHIFEHILSLGDRSALALSFFLSRFSKSNNDNSIIILDDPMSSLDRYRKDATIIQIAKLLQNKYQTFVFSHDPFFLSDIYKHSILSKNTNCFEIEVSYKDLDPLKPDSAKYISSKMIDRDNYDSYVLHSYHKEYNKLYDFVSNGREADKVEIARSIRPILEAYLRFLYPKEFIKGMWLGDMITKIRQETDHSSIFYDKNGKFSSIERINEFSKTYHHAESFDTKIQDLDFSTVQYYAKDTLQFITGL
ncbi:AAA family ATPase [Acinetobacter sp. PK01]|uniref:AAA family ATPase n=1 Tax=Acinetobacter sp. PK01 TaxID=2930198 RepID=UPI001FB6C8DE|nr:AAA family ATPase [Acinetobacter sp. PK01]UOG18333.1 AAA family ATPase [Acinetobacter sp. PK01]